MGRVFPIVTTCEIKSVRFRRIFVCFHFLSQSLALRVVKNWHPPCACCRTISSTRSSTFSSGSGSLPLPLSPCFTNCTGQLCISYWLKIYFLLCLPSVKLFRICLLAMPAFRVLVTKTWWTRKNLFFVISHSSIFVWFCFFSLYQCPLPSSSEKRPKYGGGQGGAATELHRLDRPLPHPHQPHHRPLPELPRRSRLPAQTKVAIKENVSDVCVVCIQSCATRPDPVNRVIKGVFPNQRLVYDPALICPRRVTHSQ